MTGQGDDCTTGCLLDYPYFKEHYKIITIDYYNYLIKLCFSKYF